jgi:hypothetical protein
MFNNIFTYLKLIHKPRSTRWAEHVACMGKIEMHTKLLLEIPI